LIQNSSNISRFIDDVQSSAQSDRYIGGLIICKRKQKAAYSACKGCVVTIKFDTLSLDGKQAAKLYNEETGPYLPIPGILSCQS